MRTRSELLEQYRKIDRFLKDHYTYYDDWELKQIRHCTTIDYTNKFIPDIMREIYAELDLFKDGENIYSGFLNLLENNFDINQDIIEVGGGILPKLAEEISLKQSNGTITVYDPRLGTTESNYDNLFLKKEKFTLQTDVSASGLIIGFMPCEATEYIIDNATRNKKDFMIGMCEGGPHGDIFDFYEDEDEWLSAMLYFAENRIEENNLGALQKTYMKEYNYKYPIIWNKRD